MDGVDLSPLFKNPNDSGAISKPNVAYSEYPRCAPPDAPWTPESYCGRNHDEKCTSPQSCVNTPRAHFTIMGYSVRTADWRYTGKYARTRRSTIHELLLLVLRSDCSHIAEWAWWDGANLVGDFTREPAGVELYSHNGDTEANFDLYENVNEAFLPENAATIKAMHALVIKQWKKSN